MVLIISIGLDSGSIDMIVDKQGHYYFLEINPIGQYGMISNPCNYNLDKEIAPISYYRTSEYLVQPPIKPLTKVITIV